MPSGREHVIAFQLSGNDDGFVSIPYPSDFQRAIKAKLTVHDPRGEVRILGIRFQPHERETKERVG